MKRLALTIVFLMLALIAFRARSRENRSARYLRTRRITARSNRMRLGR